jgi:hypothetical protein
VIVLALLLQAAPVLPGPIGRQALPARGCAAYLWTLGPDPAMVAMASADPAGIRLSFGGKPVDFQRTAATGGDAGYGFARRTDYRLADGTASLDLTLAARPDLVQGAAVTGAVLTITRDGADAVLIPLGGMVGCAAGS